MLLNNKKKIEKQNRTAVITEVLLKVKSKTASTQIIWYDTVVPWFSNTFHSKDLFKNRIKFYQNFIKNQ